MNEDETFKELFCRIFICKVFGHSFHNLKGKYAVFYEVRSIHLTRKCKRCASVRNDIYTILRDDTLKI